MAPRRAIGMQWMRGLLVPAPAQNCDAPLTGHLPAVKALRAARRRRQCSLSLANGSQTVTLPAARTDREAGGMMNRSGVFPMHDESSKDCICSFNEPRHTTAPRPPR
jgi:hypothetical protein